MENLKKNWLAFVSNQTGKAAADPNAKTKLVAMVLVLMIISYRIPKAEGSLIGCGPCVTWAATFCTQLIAAGGACAAVALFPPALCACLLTAGGLGCAAAAGTCAAVCLIPTI